MNYAIRTTDELYHHGILGQKWGIRRYQNTDGTLTDLGKKRINKLETRANKRIEKANAKIEKIKSKKNYVDDDINKEHNRKIMEKAELKNAWDKRRSDYKADESYTNKVVKTILFGTFGTYNYNSMRAAGFGRASSAGSTIAANYIGGPFGNMLVSKITSDSYKNSYANNKKY